jgi:hypothetical protein
LRRRDYRTSRASWSRTLLGRLSKDVVLFPGSQKCYRCIYPCLIYSLHFLALPSEGGPNLPATTNETHPFSQGIAPDSAREMGAVLDSFDKDPRRAGRSLNICNLQPLTQLGTLQFPRSKLILDRLDSLTIYGN